MIPSNRPIAVDLYPTAPRHRVAAQTMTHTKASNGKTQ
eukprot:CAMPEP_0198292178 /NCGR_PEP_ID=MMETSP1449-20131203/10601_1 /TAXON_ID=420275 /ORGANISM="Attheya septentrionalis, Strain CCMP2084" /LENGTH=37 /DNA_ID= /DNA_START= /DNA_END= /DNA_ORIENTATION=